MISSAKSRLERVAAVIKWKNEGYTDGYLSFADSISQEELDDICEEVRGITNSMGEIIPLGEV